MFGFRLLKIISKLDKRLYFPSKITFPKKSVGFIIMMMMMTTTTVLLIFIKRNLLSNFNWRIFCNIFPSKKFPKNYAVAQNLWSPRKWTVAFSSYNYDLKEKWLNILWVFFVFPPSVVCCSKLKLTISYLKDHIWVRRIKMKLPKFWGYTGWGKIKKIESDQIEKTKLDCVPVLHKWFYLTNPFK